MLVKEPLSFGLFKTVADDVVPENEELKPILSTIKITRLKNYFNTTFEIEQ